MEILVIKSESARRRRISFERAFQCDHWTIIVITFKFFEVSITIVYRSALQLFRIIFRNHLHKTLMAVERRIFSLTEHLNDTNTYRAELWMRYIYFSIAFNKSIIIWLGLSLHFFSVCENPQKRRRRLTSSVWSEVSTSCFIFRWERLHLMCWRQRPWTRCFVTHKCHCPSEYEPHQHGTRENVCKTLSCSSTSFAPEVMIFVHSFFLLNI